MRMTPWEEERFKVGKTLTYKDYILVPDGVCCATDGEIAKGAYMRRQDGFWFFIEADGMAVRHRSMPTITRTIIPDPMIRGPADFLQVDFLETERKGD